MDVVINKDALTIPTDSQHQMAHASFYQHVLTCLGYPIHSPPIADLLRLYHGLTGEWLIASPIHWVATHNDAMIDGRPEALQLTSQESEAWFEAFTEFVEHDGVKTHYHDAYTWLIQLPSHQVIHAKPVNQLFQHSLMQELQLIDSTHFWQKFITEVQMFFSTHPLNQLRENRYPINGVWVWGSGRIEKTNRMIVCDIAMEKLAKLVSTTICSEAIEVYPNNALILFDSINQNQLKHLESQLQNKTAHWYWNNMVYIQPSKHWLKRLWSRFHHAN